MALANTTTATWFCSNPLHVTLAYDSNCYIYTTILLKLSDIQGELSATIFPYVLPVRINIVQNVVKDNLLILIKFRYGCLLNFSRPTIFLRIRVLTYKYSAKCFFFSFLKKYSAKCC